jgi:two-component system cell cycle sensor histidine kinase/response regulator CckA
MSVATAFSKVSVPVAADPQRPESMASETILLVEDDENVRHLVAGSLRRRGYRVLEAAVPGEAVRIASDHGTPIHLVLSDVMLPEMDGRRLTNALRQARPEIKVLLMSGSADETLHQLEIAREEVLTKPFTPAALAIRVWSALHAPRVLFPADRGASAPHTAQGFTRH